MSALSERAKAELARLETQADNLVDRVKLKIRRNPWPWIAVPTGLLLLSVVL